jgi:hypothetical protein
MAMGFPANPNGVTNVPARSNPSLEHSRDRCIAHFIRRRAACSVWTLGVASLPHLSRTPGVQQCEGVLSPLTESRPIVGRPNSYWVDPARAEGPALRERYWSPTVLVRGPIAVVWAPYEFWEDGMTSHCDVERPADGSHLRPEG